MSQSTRESGNPQSTDTNADTRTDPAMKALYHMSRTAGVGLGDYAAINVLSVVGFLLGFACFLLLVFNDSLMMLALPVIALVTCAAAIYQVRDSNGTQVGNGWAFGGVALALLFGGINLFSHVNVARTESAYRSELQSLVGKLANDATTRSSIPAAYGLFHPRFQEMVKPESFERTLALRTGHNANDPLANIALGDNVIFDTVPETKIVQATALLVIQGRQKDEDGKPLQASTPIQFRRDENDVWKIYAIPEWFAGEDPKRQRAS